MFYEKLRLTGQGVQDLFFCAENDIKTLIL